MRKINRILKTLSIVLASIVFISGCLYLFVLSHTQIIVGVIQHFAQGTVNTENLYEPLHEPYEGLKNNGLIIPDRESQSVRF